jgi:undecaprenyl-diphosphatase
MARSSFLGPGGRVRRHPLVERIRAADRAVDAGLDALRGPTLDRVFYPLSSAADHGLLWIAIGAVRGAAVARHRDDALRLPLVMGVESFVTNIVVKSAFRRVRPPSPPEGALPFGLHRPRTSAFPSGHATSAFTAAAFLGADDPLAPAYTTLAVLVAASRVYVRMHHASDVLVGTALGLAFGRAARRFAAPSGRRRGPR